MQGFQAPSTRLSNLVDCGRSLRLFLHRTVNTTYEIRQVVFVMIALVVGFGGIRSMAQAAPGVYADAHNPSGTPDPDKLDVIWSVDNITGALSVKIPFPTGPMGGRGPKIPFALLYNSSATVTLQETTTYSNVMNLGFAVLDSSIVTFRWMPGSYNAPVAPVGPWSTTGPFLNASVTTIPNYTPVYNVNGTQIDGPTVTGCQISGPYLYSDETGSTHEMNVAYVNGYVGGSSDSQCSRYYGSPTNASTLDGSDLQATISGIGTNIGVATQGGHGPSIVYPNGTQYWGNAGFWTSGKLEDANGNIASLTQDSAGRSAFTTDIPIAPVGEIPANTYTVTTQNASGNNENYSVTVSQVPVGVWTMPHPQVDPNNAATWEICCFNPNSANNVVPSIEPMTPSAVNAVTAITLPSGTAYGFTYDPVYGTIQRINFPTGGYVRFVWGVRGDCGGYGDFQYISCLVVTDAYISSGSGEDHWSYNFPTTSSSGYLTSLTSTVTAPNGSYTSYTGTAAHYSSNLFPWGAPSWQETSKLTYTSAGKLLESVATAYAGVYPSQITTTIYDGAAPLQKQTQLKYDGYENVIEKDESDSYACSGSPCAAATNPPAWLRKTSTNYLWSSPNQTQPSYPYSQAHIVDKPSQVTVADGSGKPVSMVQYNYDEFPLSGSAGILNHDDVNYPATMIGPRGNLTSEKHCLTFSGSNCATWNASTTYRYDLAGMVVSKTDPKSYTTTYDYTNAYQGYTPSQPTDAYASTVTRPPTNGISHIDTYTYYFQTGKVASHIDENQQQTQYEYNDPLNRVTKIVLPATVDGTTGSSARSYTSFLYNDTPGSVSVNQQQLMNSSAGLIDSRTSYYDGLGRVYKTTIDSDPDGVDVVDTTYDNMGRVYTVSNPYRSASEFSYGLTTYTYDNLGRPLGKANPDGSSSQTWSYNGNVVTFTDEVFNEWQRVFDGVGQLRRVLEPGGTVQASAAQAPTLETDYSYDALGNLLLVSQCGGACPSTTTVARSFSYDGLSQLIQAFNPETGWTCYGTTGGAVPNGSNCASGYDANGNLRYKTDARGILTSYSFDPLNRLVSKSYNNDSGATPSSCYQYDSSAVPNGKGRLSSAWTQSASLGSCPSSPPSRWVWSRRSILAYDAIGRVLQEQQCTPTNCSVGTPYASAYTYDLAGNAFTFTNGVTSTPTVGTLTFTNKFGGAGRLLSLTSNWSDSTHPAMLFSAQAPQTTQCPDSPISAYAAFGGLLNATYGSGLTLNRAFDKRLRMSCAIGTGGIAASATSGSATVTITGSEQSH